MTTAARAAYAKPGAAVRTERSTEYEAIARITARLKSADAKGHAAFRDLVAAVHDNRRLWATLAADVASSGNALPDALRAQVIYLAEFTDKHSRLVLDRSAGTAPLVEINTAVLRGLRGDGGTAQ